MLRFAILTAAASISFQAAAQTTWHVDDDAPNDPGPNDHLVSDPLEDGSSDHPFDRVQEAVDAAADGDIVVLRPGTYVDSNAIELTNRALTIRGEMGAAQTILDGALSSSLGIMTVEDDVSGNVTLEGLTFQNGLRAEGGALLLTGESQGTVIRDCAFQSNRATNLGSAVAVYGTNDSRALIENCLFENNAKEKNALSLRGTVLIETRAIIAGCVFRNNSASAGAGIAAGVTTSGELFDLAVIDCLFEENHGTASGALFLLNNAGIPDARARISGSSFIRNTSGSGAGIHVINVQALIDRCVLRGNVTNTFGGGLRVGVADVTVTNCEIVGNRSLNTGGGVYVAIGTAHIENCTITANHADNAFGGLHVASGFVSLLNTICIENTSGTPSATTNYGGTSNAGAYSTSYSLVPTADLPMGADVGPGNFVADPMFLSVPAPGSDGEWGTIDDDYGDLGIMAGASPAVDAGDSFEYAGPLVDLGGEYRRVDDPAVVDTGFNPGLTPIDIGAYEAQGISCAADLNGDGFVNGADLASLLANWGICP